MIGILCDAVPESNFEIHIFWTKAVWIWQQSQSEALMSLNKPCDIKARFLIRSKNLKMKCFQEKKYEQFPVESMLLSRNDWQTTHDFTVVQHLKKKQKKYTENSK
jgi:hypothetical protein